MTGPLPARTGAALAAAAQVQPFTLQVADAELDDLRARLRGARLPEAETVSRTADPDEEWSQGVPLGYLEELRTYWIETYDWRRVERELNGTGQHRAVVDGLGIHLLHVRSTRADARPLLLTHGWPGSVVEFLDVVGELTEPSEAGAPAFHVVAPSLPGFAFSDKPDTTGWGVDRIARAWVQLMQLLGYPRFLAQGGDWGGVVTTQLAVIAPDRVEAIHTSFPQAEAPVGWSEGDLEEREARWLDETRTFWRERTAYARQQATRPQTIGYSLADSPVGLLAWIVDKFFEWSDTASRPEERISRDRLLDNVMLHWLGRSGASSARLYWESYGRLDKTAAVQVPAAVSVFPHEIERLPRSWVAARYQRLGRWQVLDRGGHFPSLEVPDLFVAELRAAFSA